MKQTTWCQQKSPEAFSASLAFVDNKSKGEKLLGSLRVGWARRRTGYDGAKNWRGHTDTTVIVLRATSTALLSLAKMVEQNTHCSKRQQRQQSTAQGCASAARVRVLLFWKSAGCAVAQCVRFGRYLFPLRLGLLASGVPRSAMASSFARYHTNAFDIGRTCRVVSLYCNPQKQMRPEVACVGFSLCEGVFSGAVPPTWACGPARP